MRVTVPTPVAQQLCDEMAQAKIRVKRIPQPNNQTEVVLQVTNDNLDVCEATLREAAAYLAATYEAQQETLEELDDGRNTEPDDSPGDGPAGLTPDDPTDDTAALDPTPVG